MAAITTSTVSATIEQAPAVIRKQKTFAKAARIYFDRIRNEPSRDELVPALNAFALCPNCHREAHVGERWEASRP